MRIILGGIYRNWAYIFPMTPSEFKISIYVESYDEKTTENYRNCYGAEMCRAFKLIDPIFEQYKLKIVSKFHVPTFYTVREVSRKRVLLLGKAGPVHRFR